MRNLKRLLSAALAMAMSLSLAAVASAAVEFDDAADINYGEAVDVMSTIGVLEGYNGEFDPAGSLTREQAAKIIAYMLLGNDANKLSVTESRYKDVAADRWSAGVIEYCSELGILAGNGDGTYLPEAKLTGYAFAKMLLGALGYKSEIEGFTGAAWTLNVANYAMQIGLDDGMEDIDWAAEITREQAAQMAMNAVKSPLVQYDKGATIVIDGQKVSFGSGDAYYVTSTLAKEQRISKQRLTNTNDYTVEFGERYFPNLILTDDQLDEFGRPAHTWTFKTEDIGTYVDSDLLAYEYTTEVKYKDAATDIGTSIINEYDLAIYVDGAEVAAKDVKTVKESILKKASGEIPYTGNGTLTEVYIDHVTEEITIAHINTYLAEVTNDFNEKTGELAINVFYGKSGTAEAGRAMKVDIDDIANADEFKKDDLVMVTVSAPDHVGNSSLKDYTVRSLAAPEVKGDVVLTAYTTGKDNAANDNQYRVTSVTSDGTKYETAVKAYYDADVLYNYNEILDQLKNATYNLYMDPYGYVLGVEQVTAADTYIFVVGYEQGSSVLAQADDKALVITTDGELKPVTARDNKLSDTDKALLTADNGSTVRGLPDGAVNQWFTYTMDGDVYVLKSAVAQIEDTVAVNHTISGQQTSVSQDGTVAQPGDVRTNSVHQTAGYTAYGNANSVFIAVDADYSINGNGSITGVNSVATGVKNVNLKVWNGVDEQGTAKKAGWTNDAKGVYAMYNSNGYITYAVVVGEELGNTENKVFFTSGATGRFYDSKLDEYYVTYDAIVAGELTEVKVIDSEASRVDLEGNLKNKFFDVRFDSNGMIVKLDEQLVATNARGDAYDDMNTLNNKHNGYAMAGDFNTNTHIALRATGFTLWVYAATSNDQYVVVNDDAKIFVKLGGETKYEEYNDLEAAVRSLGSTTDGYYVAQVAAVCDGITGYANTIIIREEKGASTDPTIPGADASMGVTVDAANRVVTANFVDGTTAVAKRNDIRNAMIAAGIDVTYVDMTNYVAIDKDGYYYDLYVNDFYSITLNGVVVDYVRYQTNGVAAVSVVTNKAISVTTAANRIGTNAKMTVGGAVTYPTYAAADMTKGTTVTGNTVIETGYVVRPGIGSITGGTLTMPADVMTAGYVKVGSSVTLTYTATAPAGVDTVVTLSIANSGTATVPTAQVLKAGQTTLTFVLSDITAQTGDITVTTSAVPALHDINYPAARTANGLTFTVSGVSTAVDGSTVTVNVHVTGTATATTILTIGGVSGNYVMGSLSSGLSLGAAGNLNVAAHGSYDATVQYTFTMPASDVTLTLS